MTAARATVSTAAARTLLLDAQGLLDPPDTRVTAPSLEKLIRRLGFVQIDSINVIERAHHLTLAARRTGYRPRHLAKLQEERRSLFEGWTHDASLIPIELYPHWKHRFVRVDARLRARPWWKKRLGDDPDRLLDDIRTHVQRTGEIMSKDLDHDRHEGTGAWWGWTPQKAALEHLWRIGDLAIPRRVNFHKVYDLTPRVYPDAHETPPSDPEAHVEWACMSALERLGAATAQEIAAYWQAVDRKTVNAWMKRAVAEGRIEPVDLDGPDKTRPGAAVPDWRDRVARAPDPPTMLRLLCPFDPVIRDRDRLARLFDFDYRFEAFTPKKKRVYGYYVLPILEGDRLVGRTDLKFDRNAETLLVQGVWWEPGVKPTKKRRRAFDDAAARLAAMIDASHVSYT